MTHNVFSGTLNPSQSINLCPLNELPNFYYNYLCQDESMHITNHLCTYAHQTELSVCFAQIIAE